MEKTYKGLSLLLRNYFMLVLENVSPAAEYEEVRSEDSLGFPIFTITVFDREADRLMQKCLDVEQGFER